MCRHVSALFLLFLLGFRPLPSLLEAPQTLADAKPDPSRMLISSPHRSHHCHLLPVSAVAFLPAFLFDPSAPRSSSFAWPRPPRPYNEAHGVRGLEWSEEQMRLLYEGWLAKHGRTYNALEEKERRFEIFKDNVRFIDAHNAAADSGHHSFRLGLNRFADITNEEYRAVYLGTRPAGQRRRARFGSDRYRYNVGEELPESIDWRDKGAVTAVKDQGSCGQFP